MPVDPNAANRNHRLSPGCRHLPTGWSATCASAGRWRKSACPIGSSCSSGEPRPPEYYREQPFGQVPCYREGPGADVRERARSCMHIGEKSEKLLPRDAEPRMRGDRRGPDRRAEQRRAGDPEPDRDRRSSTRDEEWAKQRRPRRRGVRAAEAQAGRRLRSATRSGSRGPVHDRRPDDGDRAAHACGTPIWWLNSPISQPM